MSDKKYSMLDVPAKNFAFAFSGCVPLTAQPFRELADAEPRFAEVLYECDAILRKETSWSLFETLWQASPNASVTDLSHNFPLMVALQIAMFELLQYYEINAGATIGLSCGEVSAAYAAGILALPDALRIAAHGGRIMSPQANTLRMALVWASEAICADTLLSSTGSVSIAALMEPNVVAVAGERADVKSLLGTLQNQKIRTHPLPFEWGAHTAILTHGRYNFENILGPLATKPRRRQILSTSLGRWEGSDFGTEHWWQLFTRPVLFSPCVRRMIDEGIETFLEIGPPSALADLIPRHGGNVISFADALAAGRMSIPTASRATPFAG